MKNNPLISVQDLTWAYSNSNTILDQISFKVHEGEIVGIIGPNGCGKTTLLNIMAGLLKSGKHGNLDGSIDLSLPDFKTQVGFVFQNYRDSLLPWRTVYGNIKAGRELLCTADGKKFTPEDDQIVYQRIGQFNLDDVKHKYPHEISGGQAQLTCIARALALDAGLLIMDEPTSSLHYNIRNFVLDKLLSERSKSNLTIIFSSHSLEEASILGDRIIILSPVPSAVIGIEVSNMSAERRTNKLGSPAHLDLYRNLLNYALDTAKTEN